MGIVISKQVISAFCLLFLALTSCLSLSGQELNKEDLQAFNTRLDQYLDQVTNHGDQEALHALLKRIRHNFKDNEKEYKQFFFNTFYYHAVRRMPLLVSNFVNSRFDKEVPKEFIKPRDVKMLKANIELMDMFTNGILEEEKGSFIISENDYLIKQWNFFNLEAGDVIADVGGGTGNYLSLLSLLDLNLDLTLTELKRPNLRFAKKISERLESLGYAEIKLVKGGVEETNLPANHFDKIILKNTLHHFSEPEKMFASIANSLNDEGVLYVNEGVFDSENKSCCSKKMSAKAVKDLIQKNHYIILDEMYTDDGIQLVCIPKSKIQWQ